MKYRSNELYGISNINQNSVHRNRLAFYAWINRNNPKLYAILMNSQLSATQPTAQPTPPTTGGFWTSLVSTAQQVLPTLVQTKAQLDIYKAQLKRAEQGLPPLKTEEIAPTVRIQTELGPQTTKNITTAAGNSFEKLKQPFFFMGAALLLFALMKKK